MNELKPCPFCGGDDIKLYNSPVYTGLDRDAWSVRCRDCDSRISVYDTKAEAIEKWNTRPEQPTLQDIADLIESHDTRLNYLIDLIKAKKAKAEAKR